MCCARCVLCCQLDATPGWAGSCNGSSGTSAKPRSCTPGCRVSPSKGCVFDSGKWSSRLGSASSCVPESACGWRMGSLLDWEFEYGGWNSALGSSTGCVLGKIGRGCRLGSTTSCESVKRGWGGRWLLRESSPSCRLGSANC